MTTATRLRGRIRDIFQNKGYFAVVVGTFEIKVNDPIARPKTVTLEADVKEGARYRIGDITFANNRAFTSSKLRAAFPSKKADRFERSKIGAGLEALRKLYIVEGYIDFTAIPATEFGCVTGLYSLLAHLVTQRTSELGIRFALGAQRQHVIWLVMRQASQILIVGSAIGLIASYFTSRLLVTVIFGVKEYDGLTLTAASVVLMAFGLAAAYIPARRAGRVDPMQALRAE